MSAHLPPGSRFAPGGAPYQPTPPPPPKRSMRPVALGVGAVAIIALAVIVALAITLGQAPKKAANSQARPAEAAIAFLTAVASGDATKALSLQVHQPTTRTHLTDEALVGARKVAPITQLAVVTDTDAVTEVTFQVGGETKRALFHPVRQPDGTWKVDRGTTTVQVNRRKGLPVQIDGVPLNENETEVFPGAHSVTTGLRYIAYAEQTFTVADGQAFPRIAPAPRLTDEGRQAFIAAARTAMDACLQQKVLAPPDCPQNVVVSPDIKPDLNTLRWRLEGSPMDALNPRISGSDETVAEATTKVHVLATVTVRKGDASGEVTNEWDFPATVAAQMLRDPVQAKFRRG